MILSSLSTVTLFIFKNLFAFSEQSFIENIIEVTRHLKYDNAFWVSFVIIANLVIKTSDTSFYCILVEIRNEFFDLIG